jgi:LPXTG-motif cell wall-anchored protein
VPRYLAPLIAVYFVVAALVVVGSSLAAEQGTPNPNSSGGAGQARDNAVDAARPPSAPAQPASPQPVPRQTAPAAPVAVAAGPGSVSIVDYRFAPGTITVNAGDTVTWTNNGKQPHSAKGSGFDTGILSKGKSGSHTFGSAGSFSYICSVHPFMKGTVVVRAASSGGGSGGGDSGGGSSGGNSASGGGGATAGASQSADSTTSASSGSSGSGLPATGADAAVLAAVGLGLFGLGLLLRRRTGDSL